MKVYHIYTKYCDGSVYVNLTIGLKHLIKRKYDLMTKKINHSVYTCKSKKDNQYYRKTRAIFNDLLCSERLSVKKVNDTLAKISAGEIFVQSYYFKQSIDNVIIPAVYDPCKQWIAKYAGVFDNKIFAIAAFRRLLKSENIVGNIEPHERYPPNHPKEYAEFYTNGLIISQLHNGPMWEYGFLKMPVCKDDKWEYVVLT